jgi:hypothetical protein
MLSNVSEYTAVATFRVNVYWLRVYWKPFIYEKRFVVQTNDKLYSDLNSKYNSYWTHMDDRYGMTQLILDPHGRSLWNGPTDTGPTWMIVMA